MMCHVALAKVFLLGFLVLFSSHSSAAEELPSRRFDVWQVLDVKSGQSIAFEEWMTVLSAQDVIYLGEEHRNQWHIEAALQVLRAILGNGRRPILAMEMFGWNGQAALNQSGTNSESARDRFLKDVLWDQNWGGRFEDYEPLVTFARSHQLPVLALNPPRPLVRKIATQGCYAQKT
jgi:uncharacterized iron-regulated protein